MSIRTAFFSAWIGGAALMIPAAPPAGAQGYGQGYGQGYNQGYGRPPAPVGGGYDDDGRGGGSDDAAGLTVRIDKLENQMRQLNGQIEQLQFANRRLEDQLKKFEGDVDFRLQDLGHAGGGAKPQRRGDVGDGTTPPTSAAVDVAPPAAAPAPARARRGDAFDPAADPAAVGAPRPIGSLPATGASREAALADAGGGDAPLDLSGGRLRGSAGAAGAPPVPLNAGGTAPRPGAAPTVTPGGTVIAGAAPSGPKEEFDQALGYYKDKQYDTAEKGFAALIQKNPKARIAPDAIYYLGETYYQRGRQREAAEQYLKISTDYASSGRAPEAMLRLGQALNGLGAKEQACATFGEIGRKYPNAASVKSGAERESKRLQCPAS